MQPFWALAASPPLATVTVMPLVLSSRTRGGDLQWCIPPHQMSVRVSEGTRGDEWAAHRSDMLAVTTSEAHLSQIGRKPMKPQRTKNTDNAPFTVNPEPAHLKTYTYSSLELGRLWIKLRDGRWARTQISHHVTLAYLPDMGPVAEHKLRLELQGMLDAWRNTRATLEHRIRNIDSMWKDMPLSRAEKVHMMMSLPWSCRC